MKIKYLGTAAFEGIPALFCECRICKKTRAAGGRNLRSRQQALINDELLLDYNADTVWHAQKYGLDFSRIGDCLSTHSHCDHLYPDDSEIAAKPYSGEHPPIRFYAARDGYVKLKTFSEKPYSNASVTLIEAGREFFTANGKYRVLPLKADHDPSSSPVIYAIENGGKRMLYAHDTGVFPEETYSALKSFGRLDFISFDCTGCLGEGADWRYGHMSVKTNAEVLSRLRACGAADDNTKVVLSHFSHNGGATYDEMLAAETEYGMTVAYDGLEIEF